MLEFVFEIAADVGLHLVTRGLGGREESPTDRLVALGLVIAMLGGFFALLCWIDY